MTGARGKKEAEAFVRSFGCGHDLAGRADPGSDSTTVSGSAPSPPKPAGEGTSSLFHRITKEGERLQIRSQFHDAV